MPLNDAAWESLFRNFNDMLASDLTKVMEYAEAWVKENHAWKDDTGSLTASVRGYVVGRTDPFAYFNDPRWVNAQRGITISRYIAAYPQNTPEHYAPYVESASAGESPNVLVGILTAFTEYGDDVENQLLIGGTFSEVQYSVLQNLITEVMHNPSWKINPDAYQDPMQKGFFTP